MKVVCPQCSTSYTAAEENLGRTARCKHCGTSFRLEPSAVAAKAAAVPHAAEAGQMPSVSATEFGCGGQLGDYRLLEKLGEGGMGTVYKALHTKLGRVVALKVLPQQRFVDQQAVARFQREMMVVGQLDHPHIVCAHDAREIDGTHFLVMEYVEGPDLSEVVQRCGPLPIADACELIRQAAIGLQHAHEHQLVHRDIKPSNLMLARGGQVKVLDLGLARIRTTQPAGREMTATGQAMGTADYMASEQASDSRSVDSRADIYSLGCTLYKLLSGQPPFSGPKYPSNLDKLMAHVRDPVPPIRRLRAEVPPPLAALEDRGRGRRLAGAAGGPGHAVSGGDSGGPQGRAEDAGPRAAGEQRRGQRRRGCECRAARAPSSPRRNPSMCRRNRGRRPSPRIRPAPFPPRRSRRRRARPPTRRLPAP